MGETTPDLVALQSDSNGNRGSKLRMGTEQIFEVGLVMLGLDKRL